MMMLREKDGPSPGHRADPRAGVVLLIVMLIVASMTILGGVALMVSKIHVRGVTYYCHGAEAFANADAGSRHVFGQIIDATAAETLSLEGAEIAVSFAAPTGFTFDTVTNLTRLPDGNSYMYRVVGRSQNSRATVETIIRPLTHGVPFNLFGGSLELDSNAEVTSGVGSNGDITLQSNSEIIGDVSPGPGHTTILSGGTLTGTSTPLTAPMVLDPVDPVALADAMINNNNAAISPSAMTGGAFTPSGGHAITLPAGTYFFTAMDIGKDLIPDGPVIIYCTGDVTTSSSTFIGSIGNPDNLQIYTTTTGAIDIGSSSEFYGHIYAPLAASGHIGSSSQVVGSFVCGGLVSVRSSSVFTQGGARRWTGSAKVCSWKEVRL